jgi:hypothetical protein
MDKFKLNIGYTKYFLMKGFLTLIFKKKGGGGQLGYIASCSKITSTRGLL